VTGVSYMQGELAAKQVGLLHELLPEATRFAVLANPNNPLGLGPQRKGWKHEQNQRTGYAPSRHSVREMTCLSPVPNSLPTYR